MSNYRHALVRNFQYTEGVRQFASANSAHWLIDLIAIAHHHKPELARERFVAWDITSCRTAKQTAAFVATDGGKGDGPAVQLFEQNRPYLDLDPKQLPLRLFAVRAGNNLTLMLAEEY